ncbi:hypothetical protein ABT237_07755 [Streptomyces sp. NPDC001581]|uniref:hypothetical protein n=1 Tax=Streptomyces sp. NPDC001581 TaxID=3154386 RepID=UPI003326A4FC
MEMNRSMARLPGRPFSDVVHEEQTVNGHGRTDYDLPRLLRRCVAYAAGGCLPRADELNSPVQRTPLHTAAVAA